MLQQFILKDGFDSLKRADFTTFGVLEKFWRGFEDPRSDKINCSGNQGVTKGPGPRGTRDEEFLVPCLIPCEIFEILGELDVRVVACNF